LITREFVCATTLRPAPFFYHHQQQQTSAQEKIPHSVEPASGAWKNIQKHFEAAVSQSLKHYIMLRSEAQLLS
jgi:hypothetical protein